jgi:hypothetical protein
MHTCKSNSMTYINIILPRYLNDKDLLKDLSTSSCGFAWLCRAGTYVCMRKEEWL